MVIRILVLCFIGLSSALAGPIATLRLDKGVMVRSEILYADDDFLYCRKITNPDEEFSVPMDRVPQSLQRRVQDLLKKGDLTKPPSEIAQEKLANDQSIGGWILTDLNSPEDGQVIKLLSLEAEANYPGKPKIHFRFYRKKYEAFIDFDHKMTFIRKWPVAYQVDDGPLIKESWTLNSVGKVSFSPRAFYLRDQMKGGRVLRVFVKDYHDQELELQFDINGFGEGIEQLEAGLGL
ncbi:MAG: hypothetical protein ACSHX4_09130 [Opitutaceae bacterium]